MDCEYDKKRHDDRAILMVKRDMLSPVMLTEVLLGYSKEDKAVLSRMISVASHEKLESVFDILTIYPWMDLGWSILPPTRKEFLRPDLSKRELGEVEQRQYQEDRPHVEYLREIIRPSPNCD